MTVDYVRAHGGAAERQGPAWDLTWPGGERMGAVVFAARDAQRRPAARHLTLEDPRVRPLAERLPRFAPGQPIPCCTVDGAPAGVAGVWSLWQITLRAEAAGPRRARRRIMPLFRHDDGRVLAPTARFLWDRLLASSPVVAGSVAGEAAATAFALVEQAARAHGQPLYRDLVRAHHGRKDEISPELVPLIVVRVDAGDR